MKRTILHSTLMIISILTLSFQSGDEKFRFGEPFKSVFQDLKDGQFQGTTNGILFVKRWDGKELILDFQGSYGMLDIQHDPDQIYDSSTKVYNGKTTSGRTDVKYETYASANGLSIKFGEEWFQITSIDGACDMVINGIDYLYRAEHAAEYLVLKVEKELTLDNFQYLLRKNSPNPVISELRKEEREITVLPNSTLVFAIKRK